MLNVTLGAPKRHQALTLFPLLAPENPELPCALLVDALEAATLRITEVGSGTVPTLLAINEGQSDVLVLDGEQLIGARQNRMTNRSLLLAAGSKTEIPVSCMEQGRWHHVSDDFAPAKQHSPSTVRRRARELEAAHTAAGVPASADMLREAQGAVWDAIAFNEASHGAASPTSALNEAYDARGGDLEAGLKALLIEEGQVGSLAFVAGAPLALDLIGSPRLYGRLHDRLVRGYLMDAISRPSRVRRGSTRAAQSFLGLVRDAQRTGAPSVGKGTYAVLSGAVIGGELRDDERVVHLSAFPAREDRARESDPGDLAPPPIAPPSRRRR